MGEARRQTQRVLGGPAVGDRLSVRGRAAYQRRGPHSSQDSFCQRLAGWSPPGMPTSGRTHTLTGHVPTHPPTCTPAHRDMWAFPRQSSHTSHLPPQPETVPGHAHRPVAHGHTHPTNSHTHAHTQVRRWHWPSFPHQKACVDEQFHTDARRRTPPPWAHVRAHAHNPVTLTVQCTRGQTGVHTPISENRRQGL